MQSWADVSLAVPMAKADRVKDVSDNLLDRFPGVFESIQDNNVKKILLNISGDVSDKTVPITGPGGQLVSTVVIISDSYPRIFVL